MLVVVFHSFFVLHFVAVLHSFPGYFAMPPSLHPGFSDPWGPPPALGSALAAFAFSSGAGTMVLGGHFLPTGVFLPCATFPTFSCAYQCLPRGRESSSMGFEGLPC